RPRRQRILPRSLPTLRRLPRRREGGKRTGAHAQVAGNRIRGKIGPLPRPRTARPRLDRRNSASSARRRRSRRCIYAKTSLGGAAVSKEIEDLLPDLSAWRSKNSSY